MSLLAGGCLTTDTQAGGHLTPTSYSSDWLNSTNCNSTCPAYNISACIAQKIRYLTVVVLLLPWQHVCLRSRYSATALVYLLISWSLHSKGSTCYNTLHALHTTWRRIKKTARGSVNVKILSRSLDRYFTITALDLLRIRESGIDRRTIAVRTTRTLLGNILSPKEK
jgi:hypothetical protein